jgi:hypothetical protein
MEIVSAFPHPPPYYKTPNLQPPSLPSEADQGILIFGEPICTSTSLETPSIPQFIGKVSTALENAQASFKTLVRLAVEGKVTATALQQNIQTIRESFLSAHAAINEQRKIEALFQIINCLKEKIQEKQRMIQQIDWKIQHEVNETFAPYSEIPAPAPIQSQDFEETLTKRINQALINAQ